VFVSSKIILHFKCFGRKGIKDKVLDVVYFSPLFILHFTLEASFYVMLCIKMSRLAVLWVELIPFNYLVFSSYFIKDIYPLPNSPVSFLFLIFSGQKLLFFDMI